jgi:hypothetical protein
MVDEPQRRSVKLYIGSTLLSPEEMSRVIGVRPDFSRVMGEKQPITGQPARENVWSICVEGDSDADISELLEVLYHRAISLSDALRKLTNEGCSIVLSVVLYLSATDDGSAGFAVPAEIIKWMDAIGVEALDVDQYVMEPG